MMYAARSYLMNKDYIGTETVVEFGQMRDIQNSRAGWFVIYCHVGFQHTVIFWYFDKVKHFGFVTGRYDLQIKGQILLLSKEGWIQSMVLPHSSFKAKGWKRCQSEEKMAVNQALLYTTLIMQFKQE